MKRARSEEEGLLALPQRRRQPADLAAEEAMAAAEEEEETVTVEEPEGPPHSLPIPQRDEDEEPSSDAPSAVQEQETASRPSSIEERLDAVWALIGQLDRRVEALEGLLGAHLAELVQGQQQIIQLLSAMAGAGSPLALTQPPPSGPPPPPQ
ncbi:mitochondrial fission regulator 1-like [Rhinatrema bivittatum]|uniref:mitochondrial fission regulator 1-like n=1 Tax=Rhinatrema bivittatum TaxID=194408 RepID=UPI001128E208|nr:mitochondrial fission regulator 1-like [Rhinatrema bivittatum]